MRAMLLAAGRGARMRPLTDTCPKPLLRVGGKPLIVWHIERLVAAGITHILINCSWLGHQIPAALGDGRRFGARLAYRIEPQALETAGGIANALPFFGDEPFLVVNADIWCDWDPNRAKPLAHALPAATLAHLVLVDNPAHHPRGDFTLQDNGLIMAPIADTKRLTFAGIGVYRPRLFQGLAAGQPAALAPVLRAAMARAQVRGEHHVGQWQDVGTPARLQALRAQVAASVPTADHHPS